MLASRMAVCAILALACLSSSVVGFATPPNQAILNKLTNQKQLFADNNEQNPYGLAAVTFNKGKLVKGSFLATNWNDANGNPGQGHTILQISADGSASTFATIDPNNAKIQANCGNVGIGLTMALVILSKGYVIVGSTPIGLNANGIASPGCLILLDSNGNVLGTHAANEMTTSGTMTGGGPWGMAVQDNGVTANLFVSYVLGTNPASMTTLTGANGGMVVRYGLQLPGGNITPNFWGTKGPDVIASGFPTTPGGIGGGTVGPAGLAFATPIPTSPWNSHIVNQQLFISNTLNSSIVEIKRAPECFVSAKAPVPCLVKPVAWGGLLNGNIGIQLSPFGTIVGANGGIGTLFEVAPVPFANTQLADQLVDNVNDNPTSIAGAGNLFNVLFHPQIPNKIIFNDDNFNAFFTLSLGGGSGSRKLHM